MEQLTLFKPTYKYMIDASSVFSQKENDSFPRKIHKTLWERIDMMIETQEIVTCSEIEEEVKIDDEVGHWLHDHRCIILPIDEPIQRNVRKIVTEHPRLIEFGVSGSSSGDAFLIATAMKYGLTIITEENKEKHNKIPYICRSYSIQTKNITELCKEEGWVF